MRSQLKNILNKCNIFYKSEEISRIDLMIYFETFLQDVFESQDIHKVGLGLHTGSKLYDVMATSCAVLACLVFNGLSTKELIETLSSGDLLIMKGKRIMFLCVEERPYNGVLKQYFKYKLGTTTISAPIEGITSIIPYSGKSKTLDGRGIRTNLSVRKSFMQFIHGIDMSVDVSSVISRSVMIVADRDTAEDIYHNTFFEYNGVRVGLDKIVSAAYYTENDEYMFGGNISKEDPIIKFCSKISVTRNKIIDDREKRILGVVVCGTNYWEDNSEISTIVNRQGLKFVMLLGRLTYSDYGEWLSKSEYSYFLCTKELLCDLSSADSTMYRSSEISKLYNETVKYRKYKVKNVILNSSIDKEESAYIKKSLLLAKQDIIESVERDNFIIEAFSLYNFLTSSIFAMRPFEKLIETKQVNALSPLQRLNNLYVYVECLSGEIKNSLKIAIDLIKKLYDGMYESNAKIDYLIESIKCKKIDAIVLQKAAFEAIVKNIYGEKLFDGTAFLSENFLISCSKEYNRIAISNANNNGKINVFSAIVANECTAVMYDYETYKFKMIRAACINAQRSMNSINIIKYDDETIGSNEYEELVSEVECNVDNELNNFINKLYLSSAYKFAARAGINYDASSLIEIKRVATFSNGDMCYFTRYGCVYRLGEETIDEIDVNSLQIGDSILFTNSENSRDLVDVLLQKLLSNGNYTKTDLPHSYELSKLWKDRIKTYMTQRILSFEDFTVLLSKNGCDRNVNTVKTWLNEDSHIVGPRESAAYVAIAKTIENEEMLADIERYKEACDNIRRLRMKILNLIGNYITKKIREEADSDIYKIVSENIDNLAVIRQINTITDVNDIRMPGHLINRLCSE